MTISSQLRDSGGQPGSLAAEAQGWMEKDPMARWAALAAWCKVTFSSDWMDSLRFQLDIERRERPDAPDLGTACGLIAQWKGEWVMHAADLWKVIQRLGDNPEAGPLEDLLDEVAPGLNPGQQADVARRFSWDMAGEVSGQLRARAEGRQREVVLTRLDSIPARKAKFIFDVPEMHIPAGAITIAAGREGSAKSLFSGWLAACVTRGTLPGCLQGQPRAVIILATEDSYEYTIKPRLAVAGADLGMIYRLEVQDKITGRKLSLVLPADTERLEEAIREVDAALVIHDPLMSAVSPKLNANHSQHVRQALEPLAAVAERTGAALLAIAHFNKTTGMDPASMITASGAFKDVPRAAIVFALDDDGEGIASQVKNTLGRKPVLSVAYRVADADTWTEDGWARTSLLMPGGATGRHVRDMLDKASSHDRARARAWLRDRTTARAVWAKQAIEEAKEQDGISEATLRRAKDDLGLKASKDSDGGWYWHKADDKTPPLKPAKLPILQADHLEHLRFACLTAGCLPVKICKILNMP